MNTAVEFINKIIIELDLWPNRVSPMNRRIGHHGQENNSSRAFSIF